MDTAAQEIVPTLLGWYGLQLDQVDRPGRFLDKSTAELAQQFTDAQLQQLQKISNERTGSTLGVIWQKDLEDFLEASSS